MTILIKKIINLIKDIDGFYFKLNLKYFNGLEKMNFMSLKNNSVIIDDLQTKILNINWF